MHDKLLLLTMFPASVDPRAKIKIALGQAEELPLSRSFLELSWRASMETGTSPLATSAFSSTLTAGRPAARVAAKATIPMNLMLKICVGQRVLDRRDWLGSCKDEGVKNAWFDSEHEFVCTRIL